MNLTKSVAVVISEGCKKNFVLMFLRFKCQLLGLYMGH